jgi:hypothetical protein
MGLKRYGGPPNAVARADNPGADLPEACLACSGCANPSPTGIAPRSELRLARVSSAPPRGNPLYETAIVGEVLRALTAAGQRGEG